MNKRTALVYTLFAAAVSVWLLIGLPGSESDRAVPIQAAEEEPPPTPTPEPLSLADQTGHPALMDLRGDGLFHPAEAMTRGEAFSLLAALVEGLPERQDPMEALSAAGLLAGNDGSESLTREELASFLDGLSQRLAGEAAERARTLSRAVRQGTLSQNGTASDGEDTIARGELAQVLVTLSGRTCYEAGLFFRGLVPQDVRKGDWAWAYIADAVTRGEPAPVERGLYRLENWLYAAGTDGSLLTNRGFGVWRFGPDGAYTTWNEELDGYLAAALADSGANDLTGQAALKAVYLWVKENFEYLVTPEDMTPEREGSTGWEYDRALRFFQNGGGTCYGYAAAFGLLARCLGENAQIVAATVNQYYGDHSFVVIPENGVDWIYDVELEDARPERHEDLELFHIENFDIYNYWYTPNW